MGAQPHAHRGLATESPRHVEEIDLLTGMTIINSLPVAADFGGGQPHTRVAGIAQRGVDRFAVLRRDLSTTWRRQRPADFAPIVAAQFISISAP